jgi:hypothetical protein
MNRRGFIKAAAAVPALSILAAPGLSSGNIPSHQFTAGILNIPESLKEQFVSFNTYAELAAYRDTLIDSCTRLDKNWLSSLEPPGEMPLHIRTGAPAQGYHAWALIVEATDGNDLLVYRDAKQPFDNKQGIRDWLAWFSPKNWDDVAMVPELYEHHVYGIRTMHNTSHQPHIWLDTLLQPTRGKMFYRYQVEAIVRRACASSDKTEWAEFLLRNDFDYINRLDELIFDDGRSLFEVIDDRSVYDGIFWPRLFGEEVEVNNMASVLWQWRNTI